MSIISADMNLVILSVHSLCFFLLTTSSYIIKASEIINVEEAYESDRIVHLPGQPSIPSISHFSGYITVDEERGRALFYWFFEAQSEPSNKPLLLWLTGGPGCSSIGAGAVVEIGPLLVNKNGEGLNFNPYSWNQAEDSYNFLVNWLQRFPQFKSQDFFISGESYGGHYIPQLAELIYDRNKDRNKKYPFINLKGFIVGNPETENYYDYNGLLEYAWSHAVISDEQYQKAKRACDFRKPQWSEKCGHAMHIVYQDYSEIDIYNIYAPACHLTNNTISSIASEYSLSKVRDDYRMKRWKRMLGGYDPCFTVYAEKYFNRVDVQSSFHVNTERANTSDNLNWKVCSDFVNWAYDNSVFSILPIYTKLIKGGIKIWVYSGDADGRVPVTGTRYWIESLGLPLKSSWRSWYHHDQVGGRLVEYEGLTYITVRGAGHMVPLNKPSEALSLIHSFLTGHHLPTTRP